MSGAFLPSPYRTLGGSLALCFGYPQLLCSLPATRQCFSMRDPWCRASICGSPPCSQRLHWSERTCSRCRGVHSKSSAYLGEKSQSLCLTAQLSQGNAKTGPKTNLDVLLDSFGFPPKQSKQGALKKPSIPYLVCGLLVEF